VPDLYQGTEIWDDSLVDPDNRRPVDFVRRQKLLSEIIERPNPDEFLREWRDGRVKLFVIQRLLALRAADAKIFAQGNYEPLVVSGAFRDCVTAFRRTFEKHSLVVVVPRLTSRVGLPPLGEVWADTTLVDFDTNGWRNYFAQDGAANPASGKL